jgi:hypothetical protein
VSFASGKAGVFKLDNVTPTLTDISSYITNVDFPRDAQLHETTTLGATSRTYIPGFKNATIGIQGHWDATLDAHMSPILGQAATVTFEYGPEGSTGGMVKYTGEAILIKYGATTPVDGVVGWSADLQVSGAVTRTTW